MSTQEEIKKKKKPSDLPRYEGEGLDMLLRAAQGVLRGEKFDYDPQDDPAYAQYEKTYTRLGQRAMEDTLGRTAARTGGLASSYAATAAQQSRDNYMAQLADKVPELRQMAYDMAVQQHRDQMEGLEFLGGLEEESYRRWRDEQADRAEKRDFDRQVLESDRDYERDVLESDRDYARGVLESDRDFELDVLESDRDYALGQARLTQSTKTGSKPSTGTTGPTNVDWSRVQAWVDQYGADSAEDYIREHYKSLGYSSVSTALAGWNNYNRVQNQIRQQRQERVAQGRVVNGDGQPVNPAVVTAFTDLMEGGASADQLKATVESWVARRWQGLDREGGLDLLASAGIY